MQAQAQPTSQGATRRASDIKRIHVLRSRLRMDEDAYRDLMAGLYGGKRSSTELTDRERGAFMAHLQALADKLPAGATGQPPRTGGRPGQHRSPLTPRQGKMFSLWQQLADAGLVHDRRMQALDAWIVGREWLGQRVANKTWLDARREDQVIESLKRWQRRGMDGPDAQT